jgi:hypothetical protein
MARTAATQDSAVARTRIMVDRRPKLRDDKTVALQHRSPFVTEARQCELDCISFDD